MPTVEQFGEQFERFHSGHGDGFYGSAANLEETLGPLMPLVYGKRVAEIGSGPGRVVRMLLELGAAHVTALEPSSAHKFIQPGSKVTVVNETGEHLPILGFDFVFSVGVLHHIADPAPVVKRAFEALRQGGRFVVWLYAHEGNETYLLLAKPLRAITTRIPDAMLAGLSTALNALLVPYMHTCKVLRLPRHRHMREVFARMTWAQRTLVIFDQLNPTDAKYYSREEAKTLLRDAGFENVVVDHRHGYSWAVSGLKA